MTDLVMRALIAEVRAQLGDPDTETLAREIIRRTQAAGGHRRTGGRRRSTAAAQRSAEAAELYRRGLSYDEIAAATGYANKSSVYRAIHTGIVDEIVALEHAQVEQKRAPARTKPRKRRTKTAPGTTEHPTSPDNTPEAHTAL